MTMMNERIISKRVTASEPVKFFCTSCKTTQIEMIVRQIWTLHHGEAECDDWYEICVNCGSVDCIKEVE